MNDTEQTMYEFYASYGIKFEEFNGYFGDDGFEYFYENVILKMGSKPVVKFDSYERVHDETFGFGIGVTGCIYELIHVFEGLEITLEYMVNVDFKHKPYNMYINYSVNGVNDFIDSNFYNDLESDCDELIEKLRNMKLKELIDAF